MNFEYDSFKNHLFYLAKSISQSNYHVRFETKYKECDSCLIDDAFKKMYKSIPLQEVALNQVSKKNICFESPYNISFDGVNHIKSKEATKKAFTKLQNIFGLNMQIYQIIANEELHPTPGVFWNFWYIIIDAEKAIGFSGSATD